MRNKVVLGIHQVPRNELEKVGQAGVRLQRDALVQVDTLDARKDRLCLSRGGIGVVAADVVLASKPVVRKKVSLEELVFDMVEKDGPADGLAGTDRNGNDADVAIGTEGGGPECEGDGKGRLEIRREVLDVCFRVREALLPDKRGVGLDDYRLIRCPGVRPLLSQSAGSSKCVLVEAVQKLEALEDRFEWQRVGPVAATDELLSNMCQEG